MGCKTQFDMFTVRSLIARGNAATATLMNGGKRRVGTADTATERGRILLWLPEMLALSWRCALLFSLPIDHTSFVY